MYPTIASINGRTATPYGNQTMSELGDANSFGPRTTALWICNEHGSVELSVMFPKNMFIGARCIFPPEPDAPQPTRLEERFLLYADVAFHTADHKDADLSDMHMCRVGDVVEIRIPGLRFAREEVPTHQMSEEEPKEMIRKHITRSIDEHQFKRNMKPEDTAATIPSLSTTKMRLLLMPWTPTMMLCKRSGRYDFQRHLLLRFYFSYTVPSSASSASSACCIRISSS